MCGIAGYRDLRGYIDREAFRKAVGLMHHRGPDAEGFYFEEGLGLGHRRLSIIDLSAAANQPMHSRSGQNIVVYNGEVYNFREIAAALQLPSRTRSDTEVLLESFERKGPGAIQDFNGMFAACIYNKDSGRLSLFRDRIGIKPLYYYWDGAVFLFASELKTLVAALPHQLALQLDKEALQAYMHLGFIPEPLSIYLQIKQLPAGHLLELEGGHLRCTEYWSVRDAIRPEILTNRRAAKEQLHGLLKDAVRDRLVSDVPFGAFLSGGIDSSLVTALAAECTGGQLNTFTIGFPGSPMDESQRARAVAEHLGTRHHEFMVTETEALQWMDEAMGLFDQPFADSSALPTLIVSRLAAKEVSMVLTGDGGDELFMGYGAHAWAGRLSRPVWKLLHKPLSVLLKAGNSRYQRIAELLDYSGATCSPDHIFSQEQYLFREREVKQYLQPEIQAIRTEACREADFPRKLSAMEKQALWDLTCYLKDDLLVKTDRASMHASLECRVPLLDYRVVEWAQNLDPALKRTGNQTKLLLREILADYLPEAYFNRPKQGFSIPLSAWLKGPLKPLMEEYLSEERVREVKLLNFDQVCQLKKRYAKGSSDYLYNRLWALIVLQKSFSELKLSV